MGQRVNAAPCAAVIASLLGAEVDGYGTARTRAAEQNPAVFRLFQRFLKVLDCTLAQINLTGVAQAGPAVKRRGQTGLLGQIEQRMTILIPSQRGAGWQEVHAQGVRALLCTALRRCSGYGLRNRSGRGLLAIVLFEDARRTKKTRNGYALWQSPGYVTSANSPA